MESDSMTVVKRALSLLGPLEGRIMREIWAGTLRQPFVVRDMQALMPELAYTTVMTTLNRLAEKKLLDVQEVLQQRAHSYRAAVTADEFLVQASRDQVQKVIERYGDDAMAAFVDHFDRLSPEQRERLREVGSA